MVEDGPYEVPKSFLELVIGEMNRQGLSFRDVAPKAGISASFLSRMLTGKRKLPSNNKLLSLAAALNIIPPDRLLTAAGRIPAGRPEVVQLLRSTGDLTAKEVRQVLKAVEKIKQQKRKRR